ncbi:uncharacterized protein LOC131186672 isoform X2 [Ahaetulla prasina]|uniref:uncharacterized protein LOC131186672 isoform X2 n=1 Tax=Ahaetulla prasina TaxID=499056 RepID=UPI002648F5C0|nr:uncharacterized protein LOC131186672 isoform X2 [Ahaetulla prasina]
MSQKSILGLWLSIVLLTAGTSGIEELNGILGESVTFQVKPSTPIETISWNKIISSSNARNITLMNLDKAFRLPVFVHLMDSNLKVTCTPGGTGNRTWQLNCSTGTWEDRTNIRWTSSAQSTGPTPGSSVIQFVSLDLNATCTAENPASQASRTVSLKQVCAVRLVDSDLKVTCTPEGTGNRTWQLNCSTGTWEDRANIRWTSSAQSTGPTPGSSVIQFVSLDLNATCTAENPASQASRTVSLKQVCAEERPGTEAPQVNGQTKNFYRLPLWALLCLSKVGSLLLLGCLGLILVMKTKKVGGERLRVRYLPEEPITTTQGQGPQLSQTHIG